MKVNEQLLELYNSKYPELKKALFDYNSKIMDKTTEEMCATNPLLIKVNSEWENSNLKILIFGQETNFWAREAGNNQNDSLFCGDVDPVINVYQDFFLGNQMYNSPFWNEFKRIKNSLDNENKKISVLWNNVIKIGRQGIGNVEEINIITKKYFDVIKEEINILKPDVIIFFTGPNYDNHIQNFISDFEFKQIADYDTDKLCELKLIDFDNIQKVIRTYHPQYLYLNKLRKEYIEKIISEITSI